MVTYKLCNFFFIKVALVHTAVASHWLLMKLSDCNELMSAGLSVSTDELHYIRTRDKDLEDCNVHNAIHKLHFDSNPSNDKDSILHGTQFHIETYALENCTKRYYTQN